MSVSGARITYTCYAADEEVELQDIEFTLSQPPIAEIKVVLIWAMDDQEPTLVTLVADDGKWTMDSIHLNGEWKSVSFAVLVDEQVSNIMVFTREELVDSDLNFTFPDTASPIQMSATVCQNQNTTSYTTSTNAFSTLKTQPEISRALTSHPEKITTCINLGLLSTKLFHITNNLRDINELVRRYQDGENEMKVQVLLLLLDSLPERYNIFAKEEDFEEVVKSQEEVIRLLKPDDPAVLTVLFKTASTYLLRFQHSVDVGDIEKAIEMFTEARSHSRETGSMLILIMGNLATCYRQKYWLSKTPEDIDKSIEYSQLTLDLISPQDPNRPIMMSNHAGSLVLRYRRESGDIADFDMALAIRLEALQDIPETHSFYPDLLCNMGNSFLCKFNHTQAVEDIDEAISYLIRGVNHTPEGDANKPRRITDLGDLYLMRAKVTKNPEDADRAVEGYRRALAVTPEGHPEADMRLGQLINALGDSFELLDGVKEIDEAIALQTSRVADVKGTVELQNLSMLLYRRFEKTGRVGDITEAVEAQKEAFEVTPKEDVIYGNIARQLRSLMLNLAELTKDLKDIDATLEFGERSLGFAADTEVTRSSGRAGLSTVWHLRFRCTGELADIDKAIENQREVLKISEDVVHRKYFAGLLSRFRLTKSVEDMEEAIVALQESFKVASGDISEDLYQIAESYMSTSYETGSMDAFDNMMTLLEEALSRCPPGHELLSAILRSIGTALLSRFEIAGNVEDIDNAISALDDALEWIPPDHPDVHARLNDLGKAYRVRFEHTGKPDDLDKGVAMLQDAIDKAPKESTPRMAMYFSDLGNALLRMFLLNGDAEALEAAVRLLRDAVDISKMDSFHHMHLTRLGNCLLRRFELNGNFADIDEAVSVQQAAVQATLNKHIPLRINLLNLGNAYYSRSLARESVDDMTEAVATFRKANKLIKNESGKMKPAILDNLSGALSHLFNAVKDPAMLHEAMEVLMENHPYKPIQLNNLAILLRLSFLLTGDFGDIEAMIAILNEALKHPARTVMVEKGAYQNLTWATIIRFQRTDNLADLDACISYHERALEMMPDTHFYYIYSLTSLAATLEARYRKVDSVADLSKAIELYQHAALNPTGITSRRLAAAMSWARALNRLNEPGALYGYGLAIELLPTVAWLGETVSERHHKLNAWSSLVNEAAAVSISWNRLDLAIQWLEEGRNIVWNQLNTFRTPVDDLHDIRPDLADELRRISKALDQLGSRSAKQADRMTLDQKSNVQVEARMQRDLAEKWEDTLHIVRTLEGFGDFLRPAKLSKLLEMKRPGGTVVVINIDKDSQETIHIPQLLVSSLTDYGVRSRGSRSGRPSNPPKMYLPFEDILIQLWVLVVRPIVTSLGLEPSHTPPRIWWCATGPLAFLPIHAAGIYTGNEAYFGSTTSDYVISSYTPTLNTIFSCAQRDAPRMLEKLLIVTQPETPGMLALPQTIKEGKDIQKKLQSSGLAVEYLEGMKATVEKVVESMEGSNWIHLACHAVQDPKNPTKSAFYFQDGNLELSTLISKQLPKADFAFLSACETGTGDESLPEEAVHLAAGVLQAGYRSVIATMWAIDDNYASMVSESMYSHLLERSNPPSSDDAAYALQEAAREVREQMGYSDVAFLTWVPFIHFGI
ncbi:CHAT domain-containing protein [Cyathus striatus]|nr:CHAT domain-containing protein [Cyathus striatus]